MLCLRLENPTRLADRRYAAETRLDGPRAQLHVSDSRTVAGYSRPGLDLLRHAGMAWLRETVWPVESAVLDGEACAGDGLEGSMPCSRSADATVARSMDGGQWCRSDPGESRCRDPPASR